jgi:anti-anti-sigma factor
MKGSRPLLTIRAESRDGITMLSLGGELDLSSASILHEHLRTVSGDGVSAIVLDLRELSFVDSTGLQAFLRARSDAEENGHQLLMVGATPRVRRLFELTKTDHLLDGREAVGVLETFMRETRRAADLDPEADGRG